MKLSHLFFVIAMLSGPVCAVAQPGQGIDWVLRGTVVTHNHQGYAVIEQVDTMQQQVVRVGQPLANDVLLTRVAVDHAYVRSGQQEYRLAYGDRIDRALAEADKQYQVSFADVPDLLEQLEVIPHQENGQVIGYFINKIHGDIGGKVGLQRGDLLLSVNGIRLDHELDPQSLYRELEASTLSLQLKRKGQDIRLAYSVSVL